ncbi:MAG TPA: dipeptide epimerase [Fimbriimonadales bacterium]|nr:dipeptide epimerase [Fimbriimonadales bacterium]
MELESRILEIPRKKPLRTARGVSEISKNLYITIRHDGIEGYGEMAEIGYRHPQSAVKSLEEIQLLSEKLEDFTPHKYLEMEDLAREHGIGTATQAALLNACLDWVGKKARMPLWQLFGGERETRATSITIGLDSPEFVRERTKEILMSYDSPYIKLKLGGEDGIEADKERFLAVQRGISEVAGYKEIKIRVDANGGWNISDAIVMCEWLAHRGCEYIEQPLSYECDKEMPLLYVQRKLPIFLDESVWNSKEVAKVSKYCDGVNIKLMKCGGIIEGMRMIHVARALGLRVMLGCFGESSLSIAAAASIARGAEYIDLDSHLNMNPDPVHGLEMSQGRLILSMNPGLGVSFR